MSSNGQKHHSSKKDIYDIVVIPSGDAAATKSFKISRNGIIFGSIGVVLLIVIITAAVMLYSPVNDYLPISEQQLTRRYGGQIVDVQHKLISLSEEVLVLREYNRKLRFALGQEAPSDTLLFAGIPDEDEQDFAPAPSSIETEETQNRNTDETSLRKPTVSFVKEFSYKPDFPIISPVASYISRTYQAQSGHEGIDFAGKPGSLIIAPADGYIIFSGWTPDDGYTFVMAHGNGYATVYKHNQSILRKTGEFIKRGETIALLGNSGITSYGPHLHFEVWKDGQSQNPNDYFIASTL